MKSYDINGKNEDILTKDLRSPVEEKNEKYATEEEQIPPISFLRLYKYSTWKEKGLITLGTLCSVATGLTAPANTFIFGDLADAMINFVFYHNQDDLLNAVQNFAIFNSCLGVVMLVCSYLAVVCYNLSAQNQIYRIRGLFFRSALNQDIAWYDFHQSGEVASRMNEDLSKLEDGLGEKVPMFIHFIVAFLGSVILALVKGWQLALVCLCSLPVTFISIGIVSFVTSKLAAKEVDAYAKAGNIAEEVFSAIRTVVAFGGQNLEVDRYKTNLSAARKINIKKGFFAGLGFGLLWFFIYASYALAFWYGIGLVLDERWKRPEDITYTPGVMLTVFFSVMMGSMNLGMASPYIEAFGVAKGAAGKVYHIIEQKPVVSALDGRGARPEEKIDTITFRNVFFEYPSRPDVKILQGINLTVGKGETVALVGASGCGKSTCIQLLQRFYDPSSGEVLINGLDIKALDINWVRARIGVVGQEPVLFGTSVFENIRYGNETATKEEIEAAAKAANADLFIKNLPNGYETLVGERGAQLSGGQKQRIAIARALVRDPEILLLDEATSALDLASEAKVQRALEKASKGRTTLIVAHRLSTVINADKIVVIRDGKVAEIGNHQELMSKKEHYYNLVMSQIAENPDTKGSATVTRMNSATGSENIEDEDHINIPVRQNKDDESASAVEQVSLIEIMKLNSPEWRYILFGATCSIIMGFAMPLFAVLFGDIMGIISNPSDAEVRDETNMYSLYFVLAGIAVGLSTFLQIYSLSIAGEMLTERMRGLCFEAMTRQEIGWFDDKLNGTGTLCARLSADAAAVQGATGQRIGSIIQSIATLFLAVGLSMFYQWKLGLVTLAFTPFILIATYMQKQVMMGENSDKAKAMETSTKLAVEVISSIRTVVSLGCERMFYHRYMDLLAPSVKRAKKGTHYRGLVYGLARSLMFFAYAACMFYGGYLISNEGLFYADVFKVSQALIMGTVSIANALAFAPNFEKGVEAAAKIFALLKRTPLITDKCGPDDNWIAKGDVNFNSTEFRYPSRLDTLVLRGISLEVQKGKSVALVGSSGCGKSTCIQLIQRFYDVTGGAVAIDDRDVRNVYSQDLRRRLGIVFQEPVLFDRTISENIAYGDNFRNVTQDEIIEVAKKANIHNFVVSLPLGYETRLGEKGTQLSGGQKQRIAIARALVRNPAVLLLDESTSALDAESEKIVQAALNMAKEGRTCITIAHRLSTIIDSDVIFVIDSGRVVEQGTHKELLDLRGHYYRLYKLQAGAR